MADEAGTTIVQTTLPNGAKLQIRATQLTPLIIGEDKEEQVAYEPQIPSFQSVTNAIEGIAEQVVTALKKVKPSKTTVELGLEVGVEAGQLTAVLVKGSGAAHMTVIFEWSEQSLSELHALGK